MSNICPKCGLPQDLCMCETIAKEAQRVKITTVKRRFGKLTTMVQGLEGINLKDLAKKLKAKLACGGTVKNNVIELQGDHVQKVKEELIKLGFNPESIETK